MKLPRVRVQSLPAYTAADAPATPQGRVKPTISAVEAGYAEVDRPFIYRGMAQALIYNLTYISGQTPLDLTHIENLGMVRHMGRCLWSWSSIASPYFEEGMDQMKVHALRPTSLFPDDMRVLSPRFACLLLLSNFSKVEREIGRAADYLGIKVDRINLAFATSCLDYGHPPLTPYHRLEPLPQRPGYNEAQSNVLALADAGTLPFSHYQLTRGTYAADQAKRIEEIKGVVLVDLATIAKEIKTGLPGNDELAAELNPLHPLVWGQAVDLVMMADWSRLRLDTAPGDIDDDLLILTARAIIRRIGCEGREQQIDAGSLLCLSLLTGISPAAFVRHAVSDLRRRGTTYLTEAAAYSLAERVQEIPLEGRADARRRVLVRELEELADELSTVHAGLRDWQVELPQRLLKAWNPLRLITEWTEQPDETTGGTEE